jgi:hypothetical protein
MMHSAPDRRLPTVTTNQRGLSGNASGPVQSFITLGNITDLNQISALNNLYSELVAANLWSKMTALYPFIGGTTNVAHRLNLIDATLYPLDFQGSVVFSSSGISGTISQNAFFNCPLDTGTLNVNDVSFGFYGRTVQGGSSTQSLAAFSNTGGNLFLNFRGDNFQNSRFGLTTGNYSFGTDLAGGTASFVAYSSSGTSTAFSLKNQITSTAGVAKGSTLSGTLSSNLSSTSGTGLNSYSIWYVAKAMTESELAALNAIFQKYNDTLDAAFGSTRGTDYWINPSYHPIVNRFVSNIQITPFLFTTAELNAVNTLVNSLISSPSNLWGSIGALYPFIGSTLTAQTRNIKGLGTAATAATVTGTLWTFSSGLDSGAVNQVFSPGIALTSASTLGIYISENIASNSDDVAQSASANRYRINSRSLANQAIGAYCGTAVVSAATITDSRGHYILSAPGNFVGATFSFYRNGSLIGSSTVASSTSSGSQYLFGNGTQGALRSMGVAYFIQGTQFSAAQVAEIEPIIQAYVSSLGRQ